MDTKRIFLCGSHSVGKTTLADELAKDKKYLGEFKRLHEVGRSALKLQNITRDDLSNDDIRYTYQFEVMRLQNEGERKLEGSSYISDRGIDFLAYSKFYYKGEKDIMKEMLEAPETRDSIMRYKEANTFIFLIEPSKECLEDDSTRMVSPLKELQEFTSCFKDLFKELEIPYFIISTVPIQERVDFVLKSIGF